MPIPKNWREYAMPLPYGYGSTDEQWDELLAYPGHEEGHWAYIECDFCAWDEVEDSELLGEHGLRIQLEAWRMAEARERLLFEIEQIKKRKAEREGTGHDNADGFSTTT